MTPTEIKEIQANGIDYFGHPLKVDGVWGPKTAFWHGITGLSVKRQEVVKLALGYHAQGVAEDPSRPNRGKFVDSILYPAGLTPRYGHPWCIAFVSHVMRMCDVDWPRYHVSAWALIEWAKETGKVLPAHEKPLPGDIFAFLYVRKEGEKNFRGHGGIVLAHDGTYFACCDGNVGDAVRVGRRASGPDVKFIRVINDEKPALTMPPNLSRLDGVGDR